MKTYKYIYMDYMYHYQKLIERGKLRVKQPGVYFEKHHIIPKCLGGTNDKGNLSLLTAREHYIAHWLLCKIHQNSHISIRCKLSSAFNRMCCENVHKRHYNSKQYETAREMYSQNHPMKNPLIRKKISDTCKKKFLIIQEYRKEHPIILPLCKCGCGNRINQKYATYLPHHWDHKKGFTEEVRKHLSDKKKNYIYNLTKEQKHNYLLRSCHSDKIDHIARGKNISLGKKGKKTNQVEIMGRRFANMSEQDFNLYLNTLSYRVRTRMTTYRNRYLCLTKK